MDFYELHSIRPSNWDIMSREGKKLAESVTSGSTWSADQFKGAMLALSALRVPVILIIDQKALN